MSKFCPNCVTEMYVDKRKLGTSSKWHKCPSCGVREEAIPTAEEERLAQQEQEKIEKQKRRDQRGLYDSEGYNVY